jgi:hypothetical protein
MEVVRLLRNLASVMLALSLGLHWAVLQSVGWATMVVERVQATSWEVALKSTFDGQHPCKICKFVSEGQRAGEETAVQVPLGKFEVFGMTTSGWVAGPPLLEPLIRGDGEVPPGRSGLPPVPPPRWV